LIQIIVPSQMRVKALEWICHFSSILLHFYDTGDEILVGDTFYDFVIGKARLSSSGASGEKDSMIILGQVMDDQGNVNTIRLSLDGTTSLDDFDSFEVTLKTVFLFCGFWVIFLKINK